MSWRLRCEPATARLPGLLFAALSLALPAQAQSLIAAAPPEPINHFNPRQSTGEASTTVTDLLHLLHQLDPLRVTVPHVDYSGHALAVQTEYHRRRRRAGFRRLSGRQRNYNTANNGAGDNKSRRSHPYSTASDGSTGQPR